MKSVYGFNVVLAVCLAAAVGSWRIEPSLAQPAATDPAIQQLLSTPIPPRDPVALANRYGVASSPRTEPAAGVRQAGDREQFYVLDQVATRYREVTAELRLISDHAYWWVEVGQTVDETGLRRSAQAFESQTYPLVLNTFGPVPDPGIDGDPRVFLLHAQVPGAGAYFSSWDVYPRSAHPYTNEHELLVLNLDSLRPGRGGYDETVAHELQHLVHWAANPNQDTWLDEGSSVLAENLLRGVGPTRVSWFRRQPDIQLTGWSDQPGSLAAHYDAAYLFMQYVHDRFGPQAIGSIMRSGRGAAAVDSYLEATGRSERFTDVFADWTVANLADASSPRNERFSYAQGTVGLEPSQRLDASAPEWQDRVRQFGADYFELEPTGPQSLEFTGEGEVSLAPTSPKSGRSVWWANRGDGMNSHMTRSFDLTSLQRATLQFSAWYSTETDYDHGYVAVSADGGATWQALSGSQSTSRNPTGNALGPAYTGQSGGDEPAWIDESIDLTGYVGSQILIRFEYVTDQAYNSHGFLVDDVSIPELSFFDDAEGETGWRMEGFIRTPLNIPSQFIVQLASQSDAGFDVRRFWPAAGESLQISVPGSGRTIVVVSGAAPRTLVPSAYKLTLRSAESERIQLSGPDSGTYTLLVQAGLNGV